ncbi:MAG TPA: chromate transporter [Isosphaeraceae bacterium]|nr:chromate transporter [Isosphaeraceae bacterium]
MEHRIEPSPPSPAEPLPASASAGAADGGTRVEAPRQPLPARVLIRIFLEIGATSVGGLGPSLAVIERELVARRGVLTAADVAEATAATRLLPGSSFVQVMAFLGYRLGGWTGSVVATLACVLPPVTAMLLLGLFSDAVSGWSVFGRAAQGLTAAVVGLLLASACRFGRATLSGPLGLGIAIGAFGLSAGLGLPAAAVVVAAGLVGVLGLSAAGMAGSGKGGRS